MTSRDEMAEFIKLCRSELIADIQPDVFMHFHKKEILSNEEFKKLMNSQDKREERVTEFLRLLPSKGSNAYRCFWPYLLSHYPWLCETFTDKREEKRLHDELHKILVKSAIPPLPTRHVMRKKAVRELRTKLEQLERNNYVVIYGMPGCGKTTLLAEALADLNILTDAFGGHVFWLSAGKETCVDEATLQGELLRMLTIKEISNNVEILPLDQNRAKEVLRRLLYQQSVKDCLLVLDGVYSSNIVHALNINCKIAITTRDKSIMQDIPSVIHYIRMEEGFQENETLVLLSNQLRMDIEELPPEAKQIHDLCKGFPLTISLLCSMLEEHNDGVKNTRSRWKMYVQKLKANDFSSAIGDHDRSKKEVVNNLHAAIAMCIQSLDEDLISKYYDLAVFANDVNIETKVLSTMWDIDEWQTEDIMLRFIEKCLVIRMWNEMSQSYVYCIHDLLLDYLKRNLSAEKKQALHQELLCKYKSKNNVTLADIITVDSYMSLYFGYHLKEANMLSEFPLLYLNLAFVEKKIRSNGPADVLLDFKKYCDFIGNTGENRQNADDVVAFVYSSGISIYRRQSDIIQHGLFEEKSSYVYQKAQQLALSSNKHYFELLTPAHNRDSLPVQYFRLEEIVYATYSCVEDLVFICNNRGDIKVIDLRTNHTLSTYKGHSDAVTSLSMDSSCNRFISCSLDRTVCIWSFEKVSKLRDKPRTPSPSFRQSNWIDAWSQQRHSGEKPIGILDYHSYPVNCAQFSRNGELLVTACKQKLVVSTILFFNEGKVSNSELICTTKEEDAIIACYFTIDAEFVICGSARGYVSIYNLAEKDIKFSQCLLPEAQPNVKAFFLISNYCDFSRDTSYKVMFFTDTYISVFELSSPGLRTNNILSSVKNACDSLPSSRNGNNSRSFKPIKFQREERYICASISQNGNFVAVSTTTHKTVICDMRSGDTITTFHETNGLVRSLSWYDDKYLLLSAYDNRVLTVWPLEWDERKNTLRRTAELISDKFDCAWLTKSSERNEKDNTFVAVLNSQDMLQVYERGKLMYEEKLPNIEFISICHVSYSVVCASHNQVFLKDIGNRSSNLIIDEGNNHISKMKLHSKGIRELMVLFHVYQKDPFNNFIRIWERNKYEGIIIPCIDEIVINFFVQTDSNSLFVIFENGIIREYNLKDGSLLSLINKHYIPAGISIVACDMSHQGVFALASTKLLFLVKRNRDGNYLNGTLVEIPLGIHSCKFSNSGSRLAANFDGKKHLMVWDIEDGKELVNPRDLSIQDESDVKTDLIWCPTNERILIVVKYKVSMIVVGANSLTEESSVHLTVDKILPNRAFNTFFTIDRKHYGHMHLLRYPLIIASNQ